MKEVKFVKDGKEEILFVVKPTAKQLVEAQKYSAKVFARMINDEDNGKPTALLRAKLMEYMISVGLWNDEKEKKLVNLGEKIAENEDKLRAGGIKLSEAKQIAIDTRVLRSEQLELLSEKTSLDAKTAEGSAENARFDYLASVCIKDKEGNNLFSSVEEYITSDSEHIYNAAMELASMISTVDPKWQENLPENKFLKEYKFVDDKLRFVNKEGHLVDSTGRLINEDGRFIAYDENGNQYFVNRGGEKVDKDGNKIVEFKPFIED